MVSRATKRIWKGVALGLALGPVLAFDGISHAQSVNKAPTIAAARETGPAPDAKAGNDVETVRQLVRQARKALKDGDKAKAEKLARQAADMKVQLPFYETDTPEKVLTDLGVKVVTPPPKATAENADPRALVRQG